MKTVFVTAQGAAMKTNDWTEGQEISCSESVAELFISKGIATAEKVEAKTESPAIVQPKTNNKKSK